MLTAVLCYAQPLKNGICTASKYFLKLPLSATPERIIPVIKKLRNLGRIQFITKSLSFTQKSVCATCTRPFGEVGGNSPLQLSSRTPFAKIEDKKVIAKIKSKNLTADVFLFFLAVSRIDNLTSMYYNRG